MRQRRLFLLAAKRNNGQWSCLVATHLGAFVGSTDSRTFAAAARRPPRSQSPQIRLTRDRSSDWVPAAYRTNNERNGKFHRNNEAVRNQPTRQHRYQGQPHRHHPANHKQDRKLYEQNQYLAQRQELYDWLFKLHRDLMRVAPEYRRSLHSSDVRDQKTDLLGSVDKALLLSTRNDIFEKQVQTVLEDIHESDELVNVMSFHNSAALYQSLLQVLMQMCNISCKISAMSNSTKHTEAYADLAELLLMQLLQLSIDRNSMQLGLKEIEQQAESAESSPGVQKWLKSLVASFVTDLVPSQESDSKEKEQVPDGREDLQALFRLVLHTIAAAAEFEEVDMQTQTKKQPSNGISSKSDYIGSANRMLKLYEKRPADWLGDPIVLRSMMYLLAKSGSLEGARTCKHLFHTYNSEGCLLPLSHVLDAYHGAAKNEQIDEAKRTIADEALETLNSYWKDATSSVILTEKVYHSSIVLKCMAASGVKEDGSYCDRAESVAQDALGNDWYSNLLEDMTSQSLSTSTSQSFVLLNALAHVYSASRIPNRVAQAKQMVEYMIEHANRNGLGHVHGLTLDTCNSVLAGLVNHYENVQERDKKAGQGDLDFAVKVVNYMQAHRDKDCVPNSTTHSVLFRLLDIVEPPNSAELGEQLLSKFEMIHALSKSADGKISLAMYHRSLRYWLAQAKEPQGSQMLTDRKCGIACERAFYTLQKLEMKSTPIILSDKTLVNLPYKDLYDLQLRPVFKTYTSVLEICEHTCVVDARESDLEIAARVAFQVAQKMLGRGLTLNLEVRDKLQQISGRLPESSHHRQAMEQFLEEAFSEDLASVD